MKTIELIKIKDDSLIDKIRSAIEDSIDPIMGHEPTEVALNGVAKRFTELIEHKLRDYDLSDFNITLSGSEDGMLEFSAKNIFTCMMLNGYDPTGVNLKDVDCVILNGFQAIRKCAKTNHTLMYERFSPDFIKGR